MEGFIAAVVLVAMFILGITLGANGADNRVEQDCKDYGQHAQGEWRLTCERVKKGGAV